MISFYNNQYIAVVILGHFCPVLCTSSKMLTEEIQPVRSLINPFFSLDTFVSAMSRTMSHRGHVSPDHHNAIQTWNSRARQEKCIVFSKNPSRKVPEWPVLVLGSTHFLAFISLPSFFHIVLFVHPSLVFFPHLIFPRSNSTFLPVASLRPCASLRPFFTLRTSVYVPVNPVLLTATFAFVFD